MYNVKIAHSPKPTTEPTGRMTVGGSNTRIIDPEKELGGRTSHGLDKHTFRGKYYL